MYCSLSLSLSLTRTLHFSSPYSFIFFPSSYPFTPSCPFLLYWSFASQVRAIFKSIFTAAPTQRLNKKCLGKKYNNYKIACYLQHAYWWNSCTTASADNRIHHVRLRSSQSPLLPSMTVIKGAYLMRHMMGVLILYALWSLSLLLNWTEQISVHVLILKYSTVHWKDGNKMIASLPLLMHHTDEGNQGKRHSCLSIYKRIYPHQRQGDVLKNFRLR